jgi:hypothetical protein
MLTRRQKLIIALWIGTPFALLIVLMIINPAYMSLIFTFIGPIAGMSLLITLQVFNALSLYFGLRAVNRSPEKRRKLFTTLLLIATLIVFLLPSLWLVLLYPAVITLLRTP